MIAQCQHCGAPLDVTPNAIVAQCSYCDKTNQVRKMSTVLPQTPAGWQPPPVWSPPPQFHFAKPELQYHQPSGKGPVLIVLVAAVMVSVIGGAAALIFMIGGAASSVTVTTSESPDTPPFISTATPGTPPFISTAKPDPGGGLSITSGDRVICTSGEKKMSNQKIGSVIASGRCVVTLTNCTVTGTPGIVVTDSARVIVVGGAIDSSGGVAAIAQGNAVVELKSGAKLNGQVVEQGNGRVLR